MILILFKIFLLAFLLNLVWEVSHCVLYLTCLEMRLKKFVPIILIMSLKDAFWVSLFYYIGLILFGSQNIFQNLPQLFSFIAFSLIFSFVDEKVSLKKGRWRYSTSMPLLWGVGITPLFEIAVTGILSFFLVFYVL